MKENRKLLREVLNDIRHDMTDEEVLVDKSSRDQRCDVFLTIWKHFVSCQI